MKKAIIFDMDGLILDTEILNYLCYKEMLKERGADMTKDFFKTLLGKSFEHDLESIEKVYGIHLEREEALQEVDLRIQRLYKEHGVKLKKGIIELLTFLKANNYKTIVATSSHRDRLTQLLGSVDLMKYFDDFICGDEVENAKPDPEIFLRACDKLDVFPSETIVLEDSEAGIQAAYDGGIEVICIPDMKYPEEEYAEMTTRIFESLDLVIDFLK